jgi:hypothetical protein
MVFHNEMPKNASASLTSRRKHIVKRWIEAACPRIRIGR